MPLEDLFLLLCFGAAAIPLYKALRFHYFQGATRWSDFCAWVERSYPEAWARLPGWQRRYLNPRFGVERIRREKQVVDPEFERRHAEVARADWEEIRLLLTAAALVCLGFVPRLLE